MKANYTIKVNITDRGSILAAKKALQRTHERRVKVLKYFFRVFAREAVAVIRQEIAAKKPLYNSNLTSSVSWTAGAYRATIWVADEGAVYFEYGTGPMGAKYPHPDVPQSGYGPSWLTRADGKDMADMYGWTPHKSKDGDTVYYRTIGQPSHPFWHDAWDKILNQELYEGKTLIDVCWETAVKHG